MDDQNKINSDQVISEIRTKGDFAGVFEYDGETGYFYLYDLTAPNNTKIKDSIRVFSGNPNISESNLLIQWNQNQTKVGLFIKGIFWAVFDVENNLKFGGEYKEGILPQIPLEQQF